MIRKKYSIPASQKEPRMLKRIARCESIFSKKEPKILERHKNKNDDIYIIRDLFEETSACIPLTKI
jgi:hypothetical protein